MPMPHQARGRYASQNTLARYFSAYDGELEIVILTLGEARVLNLIDVIGDETDDHGDALISFIVGAAENELLVGYDRLFWDTVRRDGTRLRTRDIDLSDDAWQQKLRGDADATNASFDLSLMRVDVVDTEIVIDNNTAVVDVTIDLTNTMASGGLIPFWNLVVTASVDGSHALSYDLAGPDGLFDVIEPGQTREGIVYRVYVDTTYETLTLDFRVYGQDALSGTYVIPLKNND